MQTGDPDAARAAALLTLQGRMRTCAACGLRPGCTQVVAAEGNPDAALVIVAEGPGREEDRLGRPLVGEGGALLDRMLAAVHVPREEVYLTTVLGCRPPGDRDPRPAETETCAARWLWPQLSLLRPRVILSLGNTATQALLGTRRGITGLRGQWFRLASGEAGPDAPLLMPMFHPAYLLRHPTRAPGGPKSLTWHDLQEAAAVLRGHRAPGRLSVLPPEDMADQPGLF